MAGSHGYTDTAHFYLFIDGSDCELHEYVPLNTNYMPSNSVFLLLDFKNVNGDSDAT